MSNSAPSASVTFADVIDAARRSRGLLAVETAGYLVLGAADQMVGAPRVLDERKCRVLVDGGRVVMPSGSESAPAYAEASLRRVLRELLQVAHGSAPALNALAEAAPRGSVETFVGELESALIPVNRAAASRALARLARESLRARGADPKSDAMPLPVRSNAAAQAKRLERALDAAGTELPNDPFLEEPATTPRGFFSQTPAPTPASEIDELLLRAVASTPPPAPRDSQAGGSQVGGPQVRDSQVGGPQAGSNPPTRRSSIPAARGVDELLASFGVAETRAEDLVAWDRRRSKPPAAPLPKPVPPPMFSAVADAPPEPAVSRTAPTRRLRKSSPPPPAPSILDEEPVRKSKALPVIALFLLAGILGGAVFLLRRKPGALSGRTPDVVEAERREAAALAASIAARPTTPCRATLMVTDVPQGAEVLVRSGVAPVDVERVPSGARLEFVATNDGYSPRRAVVPQGATWESVGGKPRYELAIQLEKSRAKNGGLDAWPAAEAGTTVGGNGQPGTVHVVASPRGAEVWMVAGAGPETTLGALPCGAGLELLVAGSAQGQPFRRRLHVEGSELTPEGSANTATGHISAAP